MTERMCHCLDRWLETDRVFLCDKPHLMKCSRDGCENRLDLNLLTAKCRWNADGSLKTPADFTAYCSHSCSIRAAQTRRYCDVCNKETVHQRGSCTNCAARGLRMRKHCDACGKETTHSKQGKCLSCLERSKYIRKWCDECGEEASFIDDRCQKCHRRGLMVDKWCDRCEELTPRYTNDGPCMKCKNPGDCEELH